jgi:hypothetical protein
LDQERNRGSEHECAEEVAKQIKDDYRDREGREAECDLQVAAPAPRIDRPSGQADCA